MRKSRFTEEQIIEALKEHAAGLSAAELCREYGVSDATFYKWRSRYGGMEISDARKLKALEDENRRLKKLLAESMLDLDQARRLIAAWVADYNTARPHSSLGYKTPAAYASTITAPKGVTSAEALIVAG
jgi:putative transposase